jgi:hypothetical protein
MTPSIYAFALAILVSMSGLAQDKAAEDKGHATLIGCLSGPDKNGKYTLRSMAQRTGVEVLGPDELKTASGSKVKLTGSWNPGEQTPTPGSTKKARRFEATEIVVIAATCEAPTEKTPLSKEKQQRQQQQQIEHKIEQQQHQEQQEKQDNNDANPPASGDTSNPK